MCMVQTIYPTVLQLSRYSSFLGVCAACIHGKASMGQDTTLWKECCNRIWNLKLFSLFCCNKCSNAYLLHSGFGLFGYKGLHKGGQHHSHLFHKWRNWGNKERKWFNCPISSSKSGTEAGVDPSLLDPMLSVFPFPFLHRLLCLAFRDCSGVLREPSAFTLAWLQGSLTRAGEVW